MRRSGISKSIITVFIFMNMISCGEKKNEFSVANSFNTPFPKSNKSLEKILGKEIILKGYNDTFYLNIKSTKSYNLITDKKTGDTLFIGTVSKFRDLYFFTKKNNDTSFNIFAVKIEDNLIHGLTTSFDQFFSIDYIIKKGEFKELVLSINKDSTDIRLRVNKKKLRSLYNNILSLYSPDTIISKNTLKNIQSKEERNTEFLELDELEFASKIYPNPTNGILNIDVNKHQNINFQLVNLKGEIIKNGIFDDIHNSIDITDEQSGIYILTLKSGNKSESIKIIKN